MDHVITDILRIYSAEEKSLSVKYNDLMKKLNKSMLEKSKSVILYKTL